jgi:hypothetical protein
VGDLWEGIFEVDVFREKKLVELAKTPINSVSKDQFLD